jgi:hypothetical protein
MARKPKNPDLPGVSGPGVAPVRIKAIDRLAAIYADARDQRIEASGPEIKAKKNLIAVLHEHEKEIGRDGEGILRYEYDDVLVTLSPGDDKLTVRKAHGDGEED